jgi:hypothetical protein
MTATAPSAARFSVVSFRPFADVLAHLDRAVGHPDMAEFARRAAEPTSFAAFEAFISGVAGPSGLLELARFNFGVVLTKEHPETPRRGLRLLVGNPLVMKDMVRGTPEAGLHVPITILVDKRGDGVHLTYERLATLIAADADPHALAVARDLDTKVIALLSAAAVG